MSLILDELQQVFGHTAVGDRFLALRKEIADTGPLDTRERELAIVAGFVSTRNEYGVRVHSRRALEAGATRPELEHVSLLQLGSTIGLSDVVRALRWIADELAGEGTQEPPGAGARAEVDGGRS